MKSNTHWPGVTKHLIALALGWFVFSVLLGLFYAFDAMEGSTDVTPSVVVTYFLKVTAVTFLIGLIALSVPLVTWKIWNDKQSSGR